MAFTDFISPILGAAGGLVGNIANVYMQNKQNEENQRLAAQNNQWNIDMWNRTNAYNTPAAQMQRLKEAGLNTSMMYGNVTNQAISMPTADVSNKGQAPRVNFDQIVSNAQQMLLSRRLAEAQINNVNADTQAKSIDNQLKAKDLDAKPMNIALGQEVQRSEIANISQQMNESMARIKLLATQEALNNINNSLLEKTFDIRVSQTLQDLKNSKQEFNNLKNQGLLLSQEILTEKMHRKDISDRLGIFKQMSAQDIQEAQLNNRKLGIDVSNYESLRGTAGNTSTYGKVMRVCDDVFGSVGQILSGKFKIGK